MPRGAQDLGNAIYAAHITWRQVGPLARYFNAYAGRTSHPRYARAQREARVRERWRGQLNPGGYC